MNHPALKTSTILRPQPIGGDSFHIGRTLAGEFIFTINRTSMKLSPAQTHDLACRLLKALGCEIEMVERQVQPGPRLAG